MALVQGFRTQQQINNSSPGQLFCALLPWVETNWALYFPVTQETSCVRLKRWCFTFSRGALISHKAQIPDQHRPDKKKQKKQKKTTSLLTFICINIQVSRLSVRVCVCVCVPRGERGVWLRLHHTWIYSLLRLSSPGDLWNEPGSSPFSRGGTSNSNLEEMWATVVDSRNAHQRNECVTSKSLQVMCVKRLL